MPNIKSILQDHQLAPNKKRGQNFLIHRQTAQNIIDQADVNSDDTIVELGVGFGALTIPLARRVKEVIGIEIDGGIIRYHQEKQILPDNVTLISQDLMKTDFKKLTAQCGGRLKIIANLPYSISNPLLFKLIEHRDIMAWAVLMLQKEVGQRLTARCGSKEYGVLSILLGACAAVHPLLEINPALFHPRPKVDSVIVRITFEPPPPQVANLASHDKRLLKIIVNGAFQQRRKTLLNSLSAINLPQFNKSNIRQVLTQINIPQQKRAEQLTIEDFIRLTCAIKGQDHHEKLFLS